MATKFVVYQDRAQQFRFRLLATNGEIIAVGEGYGSKAACLKGIKSIQKNAPIAQVEDTTLIRKPSPEDSPAKARVAKKPAAKKTGAKKTGAKKAAAKKTAK